MSAVRTLFATRLYEASLADEPGFAAFNAELRSFLAGILKPSLQAAP